MRGEPGGVILIPHLAAIRDAPPDHIAVPADVEDRREFLGAAVLREVEVRGHIQSRHRLEVQLLDDKALPLDGPGDRGLEVALRRQGIETHHVEELPPHTPTDGASAGKGAG